HALRKLDSRDCLEQRVERTAEHTRLLAGDDRDTRRRCQAVSGSTGFLGRAPAAELADQRRVDRGAVPRRLRDARDRGPPRVRVGGITGEEWREPGEILCVLADKRTDPREAPEVDGLADGRARGDRVGWARHDVNLLQTCYDFLFARSASTAF